LVVIEKSGVDEDRLIEVALDAGALDVKDSGKEFDVTTNSANFEEVKKALEEAGFKYTYAEVTMVPQSTIRLSGKEAEQMLRLMEGLKILMMSRKFTAISILPKRRWNGSVLRHSYFREMISHPF